MATSTAGGIGGNGGGDEDAASVVVVTPKEEWDHQFTLVLIGDSGVGKTSAMRRFVDNELLTNHLQTIGIEYKVKVLEIGGVRFRLEIWDTAGQERYRTITSSYYRRADGILVMFDLTSHTTMDNVHMWMKEIQRHANRKADLLFVATKRDLQNIREVSEDAIQELSEQTGIPCMEISSKTGEGVVAAFTRITCLIRDRLCSHEGGPPQPGASRLLDPGTHASRGPDSSTQSTARKSKCCGGS